MPLLPPIPGYAAAVQKERDLRERAFLDLNETVAGKEVFPLTINHLIVLKAVKSPFITGQAVPLDRLPIDVSVFLWTISPQFRIFSDDPEQRKKDEAAHARFIRTLRKLDFFAAADEIDDYIAEAFFDAPGGRTARASYVSWMAAAVASLAREFGWTEEKIRTIPLKRVWQYIRANTANAGGILSNPLSDKVRGDWLKALNRGEIQLPAGAA